MQFAAGVAGKIEAHRPLVRVSIANLKAGRTARAALPAGHAEHAGGDRPDIGAHMAEHRLGPIVVEHLVGTSKARAVDVQVVGDAVAVDESDGKTDPAHVAIEQHATIVGHPGHPVHHVVLERQPNLARKHEIGELELTELHADARPEQVRVPEPGILDERLSVGALLGEDGVEVVRDRLAQG